VLVVSASYATTSKTIRGTARADVLRGTDTADVINGLDGNDRLFGRGGRDRLAGGPGSDRLDGGRGVDQLLCGSGFDVAVLTRGDRAVGCEKRLGVGPPAPPAPPALQSPSAGPPCSPTLSAAGNADPHNEGLPADGRFVSPLGQVRGVLLFVQFADVPAAENPQTIYDLLVPNAAAWYAEASYGRMSLSVTGIPQWLTLPGTYSSYFSSASGLSNLWRDAVAAADPTVNFAETPVVYLWSARHQTPAFAVTLPHGSGVVSAEGPVRQFVKADVATDARLLWRYLAHETGHLLGLPDLYHFEQRAFAERTYAGIWDLMSTSSVASHFLAWHKWKLGWLHAAQLRCLNAQGALEETITPLETAGSVKAVVVPTGPSTAYVVEVRRPLGSDAHLCDRGVLVYTVDARVPSAGIGRPAGEVPIVVKPAAGSDTGRVAECGPTYAAPFDLGAGEISTFEDAAIRVDVLATDGSAYRVRVTRK
jgi:M6 family metalloprotease-like protein